MDGYGTKRYDEKFYSVVEGLKNIGLHKLAWAHQDEIKKLLKQNKMPIQIIGQIKQKYA